MNRIDTLHIQNFKFFQNQQPIRLGGNHMLLYGENGSGKSSVYWSLYTLFEASLKTDETEIRKYFSKTLFNGDDCLVNIHASETALGTDDYNSFIEIKTDDAPPVTYRISASEVGILGSADAKRINYASDFINYRMLLGFSGFPHSESIDLYNLFKWNIFSYVRFAAVEITRNGDKSLKTSASDIWSEIEIGPDEFDKEHEYSDQELEEYVASEPYLDFVKSFNDFHERLQGLIDYINLHGSQYLVKLGYGNFKYQVTLNNATFELKGKEYKLTPFSVGISILEYDGIPNSVRKPHSFLNEARFSAMAISIRLSILKRKLQEECLKFIVLDDLLISLDMSNRENVLEVLLSPEFSVNYQLIILTHDFSFFQLCKRKIADAGQANWIYYELFADEERNLPVLLLSDTSYTKACNHLKKFDYPAAGNYFRKATEEIFENNFPREVTVSNNGERRTTLKGYIDAAIALYERIGHSTNNLRALDNYLFVLLNPLSHRAIETNVFKVELNKVKILLPLIIQEVKDLNLRQLIPPDGTIVIHFIENSNTSYEYQIKSQDEIYLYNKAGVDDISKSKFTSVKSITHEKNKASKSVKNNRYKSDHIVDLHKEIYVWKKRPYDNSFMTNIYYQSHITGRKESLQEIVDSM